MTSGEFNKKYSQFLEEGHYGCDLGSGEVIDYLDKRFEELTKLPGFSYSQIKLKFGMGRFYCEGVDRETISQIEGKITEICNQKPF